MEIAIVGLLVVIVCQFGYILYTDRENRRERERMRILIKSDNLNDYTDAISTPDPETPETRDEYLDVDEVDTETLLKAEDNM